MTELLPAVELDPPEGVPIRSSVIWLHGLGADGHDFEPIVPELGLPRDSGVRFVFPHAPAIPVTINQGFVMPAWYDIVALDLDRRHDEDGVRRSADHLRALIGREQETHDLSPDRIVLAGFSQGGAVASYTGLRHPDRLAGILALSTYLVMDDSLERERSAANQKTPIFQAHGLYDPMVPLARGEAAHRRLVELDYDVEWHTYPMPHAVHPQEIADIGAWLVRVLGC
jgi:phospholipase/carboxylesterase